MRHPRVLFYAVDGLGLGHVTRLLGIARALRQQSPSAEILFVTASEAAHVIFREGFAALKVPSRQSARAGGLRQNSFMRLVQSTVWNAATAFDPHCIVVDTFAAGALHELLPLLRWPWRKVFVFRAQKPERATDAFLQNTLRLYDLILVPHDRDANSVFGESVPVPPEVRAVWTGPMVLRPTLDLLSREAARAELGLPADKQIGLFSLGGGGDPEIENARRLFEESLQVLSSQALASGANKVLAEKTLWVELAGPLSASSPQTPQRRVLREVHPLAIYLRAFDFALCAAGYNSAHELQAAQVPCALWPFERNLDDQTARAQRFAQSNRALCIGTGCIGTGANRDDDEKVREIAEALRQLGRPESRALLQNAMQTGAPMDGAARGATAILQLMGCEAAETAP